MCRYGYMYYMYVVLWSNDGSLHYLCHYMDCIDGTILQRPHSSTGEHTHTNGSNDKFARVHDGRTYLYIQFLTLSRCNSACVSAISAKFDQERLHRYKDFAK